MQKTTESISIPAYFIGLSQSQSRLFVDCMTHGVTVVDNMYVANFLTHIALHAGWSASITKSADITVHINKNNNTPKLDTSCEKYESYKGIVYCLEIPDTCTHVYYMRDTQTSSPHWTGNSSRAGQKGVCGNIMHTADMPSTAEGVRPDLIINPHAIPSRMTIGQLYESQVGNLCAAMGTTADATIFRKIDINKIGDSLEAMGMNRDGYHRLYSGITGEYIDVEVFMGPTTYQRLQKYAIDTIYSISQGPTDSLTHQQLDGKTAMGGIRIGEMERDCLVARGASKFVLEKYTSHADKYDQYMCRCGKPAIVNVEENIYKCKYCKDNADIAKVPTTWSSKLTFQEISTMNVGARRYIAPFVYEGKSDPE